MNLSWDLVTRTIEALTPVLIAILSWLSYKVAGLINAKAKTEHTREFLLRIDDAVFAAVREASCVVFERMKEEGVHARLSAEERARIRDTAVAAIRVYLGSKGISDGARVLGLRNGDLEKFLAARVEAALYELRASHPSKRNGAHAA